MIWNSQFWFNFEVFSQWVTLVSAIVAVVVNFFTFSTSSLEPLYRFASILRGYSLGAPLPYLLKLGISPISHFIIADFMQFFQFLKKILLNNRPEIIHIWVGESPGDVISTLLKLGHCDLYLRCKGTIFIKHIFDFSQSSSQILMKYGSYMHQSNVSRVCLCDLFRLKYANELCRHLTYFLPLVTSLPGLATNFVLVLLCVALPTLLKLGCFLYFSCNFGPILHETREAYLDVYMNHILWESAQQFERSPNNF